MRLMFSNRTMAGMVGGVQRAITTVMNAMAAKGHEVNLLTWDQGGAEAFFPMSPEIRWHRLDLGDTATKASGALRFRRAAAIRKLIRECRPQLIIGFEALNSSSRGFIPSVFAFPRSRPNGARRPVLTICPVVPASDSLNSTVSA